MKEKFFCDKTSVIDEGAIIGSGTKIWHFTHIMNEAVIGDKCILGQNVMIGPKVEVGNNVKIQNNVSIYEGVKIGDDVFLGPSMVFTNVINPRSSVNRKKEFMKTLVERGVTIGANATIVCGVTLGTFCFIGAGAVITKDVKPYALMVGNPARQIGWMSENGNKLSFDAMGIAKCFESGVSYILKNEVISKL